ncbi:MAG: hypothetical protein P9X24_09040 [Candidatus Hatepunaea meridiana]|nr:hypothetical protein [Candidatus Hatepunaea meridiana]
MPTLTIKSDKPMVLIPLEKYESMKETIDILSDSKLVEDVRRGIKDFEEGRSISMEDIKKELDVKDNQSEEDNG